VIVLQGDTQYSTKLGGQSKDNIIVLSVNENIADGFPLGKNYQFEITGMLSNLDGYLDNNRIKVSFSDKTGDGIVDDPDSFNNIVAPDLLDSNSNTRKSFVYLQTIQLNDQVFRNIIDSNTVETFNSELDVTNLNSYNDGQLFYFYSPLENVVKKFQLGVGLVVDNTVTAYVGRPNIKFQYIHTAGQDYRIDPCKTNIIDIYIVTLAYYTSYQNWIKDSTGTVAEPTPPTLDELTTEYAGLQDYKMISDNMILNSVQFKPLFGSKASPELRATIKVIKNSNVTSSDSEIRVAVLNAMNDYFDIANWNFGDTFYFSELSAYLHRQVGTLISSAILVPNSPTAVFGDLYEIRSAPYEIFVNAAQATDIVVISALTADQLR
jgi:hypothetical protein